MSKQQELEKLAELEQQMADLKQKAAELRAIIDKSEVKPLFPKSWEEGARFVVNQNGEIIEISSHYPNYSVEVLALQGRTFYTYEDAEAFSKRERAKAYCLERINEANEGDNEFKRNGSNWLIDYNHLEEELYSDNDYRYQSLDACEYMRTSEAVDQLINDLEFVEQFKIWKGIM